MEEVRTINKPTRKQENTRPKKTSRDGLKAEKAPPQIPPREILGRNRKEREKKRIDIATSPSLISPTINETMTRGRDEKRRSIYRNES